MRRLWSYLLPPVCVLCAGPGSEAGFDLCAACARDLPINALACERCGEHLQSAGPNMICGSCLRRPPKFHAAHCAFQYGYPVDRLVRVLKYHGRIAYSRVLGSLLAQSLQADRIRRWPELMVPVPLAIARFRVRGFNQAIELGKQLERRLHIPMRADILIRQRATSEQAGLDRVARRKNVRGAFALLGPLPAKHIAIVDDVVTTGSTANEIAGVLRRAGADRVEVWAVARAAR
jgi:ComF family protein